MIFNKIYLIFKLVYFPEGIMMASLNVNDFLKENIYEKIYVNSFIKLANKYWLPSDSADLKEYLIERFIEEWGRITEQVFVSRKNNMTRIDFWNVRYLPIYTYSFHVIFENENDAILTFFYDPSFYNTDHKVYKNLQDIELHINELASWKWPFTLIIQRWSSTYKTTNTAEELYELLAA